MVERLLEVMVQSENQTSISRRKNENFKATYSIGFKQETENVGTFRVNSIEDGSIGVHNIHDPKVLERVNGNYCRFNSESGIFKY